MKIQQDKDVEQAVLRRGGVDNVTVSYAVSNGDLASMGRFDKSMAMSMGHMDLALLMEDDYDIY